MRMMGNWAEKKFYNNFHLCDRRMDRQVDKWNGTIAKTALTRSISGLKPHQIVLMWCCTTSIIHTYLLQCPVDSNCKLWTPSSVY